MFKILRKTAQTGLVTIGYPKKTAHLSTQFRGAPRFAFSGWRDARPAAEACPTAAISIQESDGARRVTVDYGLCVYCGQCAEADPSGAVEMTREFELAALDRRNLVLTAEYAVDNEGIQYDLKKLHHGYWPVEETSEILERNVRARIRQVLGRSLAIREVDAGSCNGCEVEITALSNPIYDAERLGIHFVASPRHADMLLVTGPVTRNMELALLKAYRATPDPKVVVAVGACGISGGIFGRNYATLGGVDQVVPVDVFIPGCPPRPEALLHGILLAVGRIEQKGLPQ
ncbi:MAG TPA: NADH-quinone oxidoreductase subunit NuoB [Bryobacteraceae bacterium]|nr:NADH-quinone oxidoreductase subunit NuoB [Bryobacteraceae bacterium]